MNTTIKDNGESFDAWQSEKAIARLGGEKALVKKLAVLFIRDSPNLMETVKSGINQKDYDNAFTALHSLQGTSGNFYTLRFEEACANVQRELKSDNWEQAEIAFCQLAQSYLELDKELVDFTLNVDC
jgi:HPt (histidine-containing phosphotransfer) domain-containing protein